MPSIEQKRDRVPIENMSADQMKAAMHHATSISAATLNTGWPKSGRYVDKFKARAIELGIELVFEEYERISMLTDMQVFRAGSPYSHFPERIIERGNRRGIFHNECDECVQQAVYNGKPLKFKVHRLNGIYDDLRPENVRLLCPNCYSQVKNGRN